MTPFLFAEKGKIATKAKKTVKETVTKDKSKSQKKKKATKEESKKSSLEFSTAQTLTKVSEVTKESTQKASKENVELDLPVLQIKVCSEKSGGLKSKTTKEVNKKVCQV